MPPTRMYVEDEELGWLCQVDISAVQRDHMESVVIVVVFGALFVVMVLGVLAMVIGYIYETSPRFQHICHPRS